MKTKCMALLLSIGVFTSLVGCQMREVTEDEVYEKFKNLFCNFNYGFDGDFLPCILRQERGFL